MKGVVLSGGAGTRLRPLTHTGPKQLIPIANKPNIVYCIEDLRNAGITDIAVILGNNMPEKVKELLGDGSNYGVKITYIYQGEPKGIAHAVGLAEEFVGDEPFVVYLGDNLLIGGIGGLVQAFEKTGAESVIGLCEVPNPQKFGIAVLNERKEIVRVIEKPKEPPTNLAIIGIYLFRKSVFEMIKKLKPSWRNELEITDAIQMLIDAKLPVHAYIVTGWWKDTGTPEDILEANRVVLEHLEPKVEGTVEEGAEVIGKVSIGKNSIIKKGARVRGPAIIGDNTIIEGDAYIGPYTAIGNNCKISRSEIEFSIILDSTEINYAGRIVDSLIGANTRILSGERKPRGQRFILGENSTVWV
ncbi:MAG: glucose-1-phosphate thymidylyltransferase [Thermoplasmata archaeon]